MIHKATINPMVPKTLMGGYSLITSMPLFFMEEYATVMARAMVGM